MRLFLGTTHIPNICTVVYSSNPGDATLKSCIELRDFTVFTATKWLLCVQPNCTYCPLPPPSPPPKLHPLKGQGHEI